jgi:hypothetical protein
MEIPERRAAATHLLKTLVEAGNRQDMPMANAMIADKAGQETLNGITF